MSFQPFAITKFQTGEFTYLQPWIRPEDAWEPLINGYIYRGVLNKRNGRSYFGQMVYQDTIGYGNGGKSYSGTLAIAPILAGSFGATNGVESFTDNGAGVLTGNLGGTGTIDYTTGAWALTFNSTFASSVPIYGTYSPNLLAPSPIMGIKQWQNETTGGTQIIIFDTNRASIYAGAPGKFLPIATVNQTIFIGNGSSTSATLSTGWASASPYTYILSPYTISITDGTTTITDTPGTLPNGTLSSGGNFAAGGTVNYATGVIALNFSSAISNSVTITMTATLNGNYFTGNGTNFFNDVNWQNNLYVTNNKDQITSYNGTGLSRQPFSITLSNYQSFTNDINTCLDIDVYKNRFLVIYPQLTTNVSYPQSIRWSQQFVPNNLAADVSGNGGELSAPTGDIMQSAKLLRDQFIIFYNNSVWTFRYTGNDFSPFRYEKVNSTKSTNAPYGTVAYDERVTSMGSKGLIACDGVNVQRYDVNVVDQYLDINQKYFAQCYGTRFDVNGQTWMLYPSAQTASTTSTNVIVYNFLENTWANFYMPLSCVGLGYVDQYKSWSDFASTQPLGQEFPNWAACEFPWDAYFLRGLEPTLLGGGLDGIVYQLNVGEVDAVGNNASNALSIDSSFTSKRWNPFIETGQKVQFGWVDFYYSIDSGATTTPQIQINFYTDNSNNIAQTNILTLDGPENSQYTFKRIYINNIGQFLQMNISSMSNASFQILGIIFWARPAGRLTP